MDFMSFYWQVTPSPGSFASFSTGLCSLLFIRSDQPCCAVYPPLRPYLHITLLSLCTVCWSFFEAWFSWWDVAAIQRAFYFSLLALKHGGGRLQDWGRQIKDWGMMGGEKKDPLVCFWDMNDQTSKMLVGLHDLTYCNKSHIFLALLRDLCPKHAKDLFIDFLPSRQSWDSPDFLLPQQCGCKDGNVL